MSGMPSPPTQTLTQRFESIFVFGKWRGEWGGSTGKGRHPQRCVRQIGTVDDGSFIPKGLWEPCKTLPSVNLLGAQGAWVLIHLNTRYFHVGTSWSPTLDEIQLLKVEGVLRICISHKLLGIADSAGTTL